MKIGELQEKQDVYVASVVTQDGSLVEKVQIDKESGWMRRKY